MYGHTTDIIRRGKAFFFMKNVVACAALLLAIAFDMLIGMNEQTSAFSSGVTWLSLLAIPFILFYQPRLEPRKLWEDGVYIVFYAVAYSMSVICGIIVIATYPYISVLIEFLGEFVSEIVKLILPV